MLRYRWETKAILNYQVQWLTDFADQAVVLPAGIAIVLVLLLSRWWRGAVCWTIAVAGVLAVMLVLKLMTGACGWVLGLSALNSPSGHTASATVLYGGLLTLLFPELGPVCCLIAALLIGVVFAISRIVLHDHTVIEVVVGGLVGLCGVLGFRLLRGPVVPRPNRLVLVGIVLVVILAVHGTRLQAERNVHSFAVTRFRAMLCPLPKSTQAWAPPRPEKGQSPF